MKLGRKQRRDVRRRGDAVELPIKKFGDGCVFLGAETAVAILHQHTRSGRKVIVGIGVERKHRRADDAQPVPKGKKSTRVRSKRPVQPRLNGLHCFPNCWVPRWIEEKFTGENFAYLFFVVTGGWSDLVMLRQFYIEKRQLGQIPGESNPITQLHNIAV